VVIMITIWVQEFLKNTRVLQFVNWARFICARWQHYSVQRFALSERS